VSGAAVVNATANHSGSAVLMLFAFLVILVLLGRVFDFVLVGYRLPAIICSLALIASLFLGGLAEIRTRVGLPLLGWIIWMWVCVPFSNWPGGSFQYAIDASFFSFMWLPMAAGPRNMKDVRRIAYAAAAACTILLVASDIDKVVEGAARLQGAGSTFANSEDVALWAGFAMPLCLFAISRIRMPLIRIPLAIATVMFFVRLVAFTGSRAGIIALLVVASVHFFRSGALGRVAVLGVVVVCAIVILVTVPGHLIERLGTLFGDEHNAHSEAAASARSRRELAKDAAMATLRNPVFGVGPGMFAQQRWSEYRTKGERKDNLVTHNAYLQVSSESGLPGGLCYVMMLYGIFKTVRILRARSATLSDPEDHDRLQMLRYLELSFVHVLTCNMFISIALYPAQFVIAGLVLATERIANQKTQSDPSAAPSRLPKPLAVPAMPAPGRLNARFPAK
jgi:O-antigen ligase